MGGPDEEFDTLLRRLTDDLDQLRSEQGLVPDLVTLTGDLAEFGMRKEYDNVLRFCEGVQAHLKLDRDRTNLCGGAIALSRAGMRYEVRVNWLTGGVDIVSQGG